MRGRPTANERLLTCVSNTFRPKWERKTVFLYLLRLLVFPKHSIDRLTLQSKQQQHTSYIYFSVSRNSFIGRLFCALYSFDMQIYTDTRTIDSRMGKTLYFVKKLDLLTI